MLIAVPDLSSLEGVVKDAMTEDGFKLLVKKRHLIVEDVNIYLETQKTKTAFKNGVVLAVYPSSDWLDALIQDHRTSGLVYIPWTEEELKTYLEKHSSSTQI